MLNYALKREIQVEARDIVASVAERRSCIRGEHSSTGFSLGHRSEVHSLVRA